MDKTKRPSDAKTARGVRELKHRMPKLIEDTKNTLILNGQSPTWMTKQVSKDLAALLKPYAAKLSMKNLVRPFEDAEMIEFLCAKNDCTHFIHSTSNKKHPHAMTFGTTFDGHVMMMFELLITKHVPMDVRQSPTVGSKCCLVFQGSEFENELAFKNLKLLLLDMFRKEELDKLDITSLEYAMVFTSSTIDPLPGSSEEKRLSLALRCYKIVHNSGVPTLVHIGSGFNAVLSRYTIHEDILKKSLERPRPKREGKKPHIEYDAVGNQMGKVFVAPEKLDNLALRKFGAFDTGKIVPIEPPAKSE